MPLGNGRVPFVSIHIYLPALLTVTAQAIYVPRIDKMMGMARDMEKKED